MKKTILCGMLACAVLGSALCTAACREELPPVDGIAPGTVVTDETITKELYEALTEGPSSGIVMTASGSVTLGEGEEAKTSRVSFEGAFRSENGFFADLFAGTEGDEENYLLFFLRGEDAYTATGERTEHGASVKSELGARLKGEDPIVLSKCDLGAYSSLLSPAGLRILRNLTALGSGVVTKTEGGYELVYDTLTVAGKLLDGAIGLVETVEKTAEMTLSALFGQNFVKDTLGTLFTGVGAQELVDLVSPLLPEGIANSLPAAEKSGTAYGYLEGLLRSGTFFEGATAGAEGWSDYRSFGEVPLQKAVELLFGGEWSLEGADLGGTLKSFSESLEKTLVSQVASLLGATGEAEDADADLLLTFSFDDGKKLLGLTLEGACAARLSAAPAEMETDGVPAAAAGGTAFRASFKLSATASSPDFFDLKGCKVYGENGEPEQIAK